VHVVTAINVHKDDYLAVQKPERDHTLFAIRLPSVLAGVLEDD